MRFSSSHSRLRFSSRCSRLLVLLLAGLMLASCTHKEGSTNNSSTVSASEGGTVTSDDGRLRLEIPAGALTEDTAISAMSVGEDRWQLGPDGLQFLMPATAHIQMPESLLDPVEMSVDSVTYDTCAVKLSSADGTVESLELEAARTTDQGIELTTMVSHFSDMFVDAGLLNAGLVIPEADLEGEVWKLKRGVAPRVNVNVTLDTFDAERINGMGIEQINLLAVGDNEIEAPFPVLSYEDSVGYAFWPNVCPADGPLGVRVVTFPIVALVTYNDGSTEEIVEHVSITVDCVDEDTGICGITIPALTTGLFYAEPDVHCATTAPTRHNGMPKEGAGDHSDIEAVAVETMELTQAAIDEVAGIVDCMASTSDTMVVCADGASNQLEPGSYVVVSQLLAGAVPFTSPDRFYQYGFVFDSDGNPANNYVAPDEYPDDFFQDSDFWFELLYDPSVGWILRVSDAKNGEVMQVPLDARVFMEANALTLIARVDAFSTPEPTLRVTAFCHDGNYGLVTPFIWTGSTHPTIDEGMMDQDGNVVPVGE